MFAALVLAIVAGYHSNLFEDRLLDVSYYTSLVVGSRLVGMYCCEFVIALIGQFILRLGTSDPHSFRHELYFLQLSSLSIEGMTVADKVPRRIRWPKPVDLGDLGPEERANVAIEMSSIMGEIMLDSIRDRHPGISEAHLLRLARKRILKGRSGR